MNAFFKKTFGIDTPIHYLPDIKVEKKIEKQFARSWKRMYRKKDPRISDYRKERFAAFFRTLLRDGSDERYCKRVEIRWIDAKVGFGVFAKEVIPPYSTLNQYTGIVMLDREVDPNHDSTFSFTDLKNYSIDAMHAGNWTRFINHGEERHPKTNAIAWEVCFEDLGPRIVFTSGKEGIKRGEQILYSYGDEYWNQKKALLLL